MPDENFSENGPKGIEPFDLFAPYCPECGRPTIGRPFFPEMTRQDCSTCMDAVTRHFCTKRPLEADADDGQKWTCPDCGSIWRMTEHWESCQDCCLDCDHEVNIRSWGLVEDHMENGPRREPLPVYTPLRNIFREGPPPPKEGKYPFPGLPF